MQRKLHSMSGTCKLSTAGRTYRELRTFSCMVWENSAHGQEKTYEPNTVLQKSLPGNSESSSIPCATELRTFRVKSPYTGSGKYINCIREVLLKSNEKLYTIENVWGEYFLLIHSLPKTTWKPHWNPCILDMWCMSLTDFDWYHE